MPIQCQQQPRQVHGIRWEGMSAACLPALTECLPSSAGSERQTHVWDCITQQWPFVHADRARALWRVASCDDLACTTFVLPAVHDGTMPFSSGAVSYKSSTTESSTICGLEEATISCGVTAAAAGNDSRGEHWQSSANQMPATQNRLMCHAPG